MYQKSVGEASIFLPLLEAIAIKHAIAEMQTTAAYKNPASPPKTKSAVSKTPRF